MIKTIKGFALNDRLYFDGRNYLIIFGDYFEKIECYFQVLIDSKWNMSIIKCVPTAEKGSLEFCSKIEEGYVE